MGDTGVKPSGASSLWERPRLTFRRLSGLDRSGPPPPQTLAGSPLNPWTIPNAIGFVRLALIPIFFVVAMTSSDGTGPWPAILFGAVAWTDYADGIAARVTGQYSRLGTLMDPVADRLLIISGVVVCWNFELLPRWALAVLVAREVAMLGLARYGLRQGVDVAINWPGRLAVWPVMAAIFMGLVELFTAAEVALYIGVVLSLWSFALYARLGFAAKRSS
ncbi:MAG: CDP-alcohol phosphatidyltransferase family protein [Solirubrobacteraceae bacterium]